MVENVVLLEIARVNFFRNHIFSPLSKIIQTIPVSAMQHFVTTTSQADGLICIIPQYWRFVKENFDFTNLKTIILTHHDVDHMGNVKSLLKLIPQIELIVFEDEADYINSSKTPCKIEMIEKNLHKL